MLERNSRASSLVAPQALVALALVALTPRLSAQWSQASLSQARSGIAAARVRDVAVFAGGRAAGGPSDVVDLYDSSSDVWSVASLSLPRSDAAAAASGSLALIAGGRLPGDVASARVDVFDVESASWSTASLSVARFDLAGAAVGDWILFAGGQDESFAKFAVVDLYHVPSGAWSVASLSAARSDVGAATAGGRALFAGGFWSIAVDLFAPPGSWTLGGLHQKRGGIGAVGVGERALFAGGLDAGFLPTATVDLYDAATGQWSVQALSKARTSVAAASIEALTLFAGGWNEHGSPYAPDATLDLYDAVTRAWQATALPAPRADLAAVALDDRVLFAGGLDLQQQPSDTVWTYRPPLAGASYCFGASASCPCANAAGTKEGCRNSTDAGGCLRAGGSAGVGADDLMLEAEHLPISQPMLLFAGVNRVNGGDGVALGDGLRCAGGALKRLGVIAADAAGRARFGPGLVQQGGFGAGEIRRFQGWYRDPHGGPCGFGFNLTNAVEVVLLP